MSADTIEVDIAKAGLIQRIQGEAEVRQRKGEAQAKRLAITEKLKAAMLKLNQQISECVDIDNNCEGLLHSIERAKSELLATTPEGKQIRSLLKDIHEMMWVKGDPVLVQLRYKIDLADRRGEDEEAAVLKSQLANLDRKIEAKQSEINRIWMSFGLDAESLPKA